MSGVEGDEAGEMSKIAASQLPGSSISNDDDDDARPSTLSTQQLPSSAADEDSLLPKKQDATLVGPSATSESAQTANQNSLPAPSLSSGGAGTATDPKDNSTTTDGDDDETLQNSRGARILMNRFSNWRQMANDSVTRNTMSLSSASSLFRPASSSASADAALVTSPSADSKDVHSKKSDNDESNENSNSSSSNDDDEGESSLEEEGSATDEDYEKSSSEVRSSTSTATTDTPPPPRMTMAAKVAASVVADTVASGFRGRYSTGSSSGRSSPTNTTTPTSKKKRDSITSPSPSQTSLILQSRAAKYMQSIMDALEPFQYVMLLGNGMLGVNLKQTYLRNHGVYVDFLVRGGAAYQSDVVRVGDTIVKVGETDVRKGTISNVPRTIADAKRPAVLVFGTGQERLALERMNYVDVAVGMMHKWREEGESGAEHVTLPKDDGSGAEETEEDEGNENGPSRHEGGNSQTESDGEDPKGTNGKLTGKEDVNDNGINSTKQGNEHDGSIARDETLDVDQARKSPVDSSAETAGEGNDEADATDKDTEPDVRSPTIFEEGDMKLSKESSEVDKKIDEANEGLHVDEADKRVEDTGNSPHEAESSDETPVNWIISAHTFEGANPTNVISPPISVRRAISGQVAKRCNENFSLSALDQVASSDANFRAALQNAFVTCAVDGRRLPFLSAHFSSEESFETDQDEIAALPKSTVGTQLMLFLELMSFLELHALTPAPRRWDLARKIAYKFFLPSTHGSRVEPPMFDFHHIVPDSDLRALEKALTDVDCPLPRNLFVPFQKAVMDSLCGTPFISFLISDECARMRAYLRNTAPLMTVCPKTVFDGITGDRRSASANNYFLYLLSHLICQRERSIGGENDDVVDDSGDRVANSAAGIACAVFIKRDLEEAINKMKDTESGSFASLVSSFEHLWEVFVAPGGGMLEGMSSSNEIDDALAKVRSCLREATKSQGNEEKMTELLTSSQLNEALDRLSTELLYGYATGPHQKFKEHKFHEWMCSEVCKLPEDGMPVLHEMDVLSMLPSGCIRRLLRRVELPTGVSAHKPIRSPTKSDGELKPLAQDAENLDRPSERVEYANADFAFVFGSDDGSEVEDRVVNPAMDRFDIRRYVCSEVIVDNDERAGMIDSSRMPPTLESYATVPSLRRPPFSKDSSMCRLSSDGWEVSLISFMVPNVESSSAHGEHDSALYGVSLVLQQGDIEVATVHPEIELSLRKDTSVGRGTINERVEFASPVKFESRCMNGSAPQSTAEKRLCTIIVNEDALKFNQKLQERTWNERLRNRQSAGLVEGPLTVGLALVSNQNTVLAMRDTLSLFFLDICRSEADGYLFCAPLVELLGNFAHDDVEKFSLKCILEPYLRHASSPWLETPLRSQKHEFAQQAGQQLVSCLPPIPLALLFVTILMEQKVVFSSSRRSILFSAVSTITSLLAPLRWSHLLVPLVPSALGRDLLQYPAPYILGISTEDPGNIELLNSLPMDVTLVDLDVGRVILAPEFASNDELLRGSSNRVATAAAIRSQTLYLAQALGVRFGSALYPDTWHCDSPLATQSFNRAHHPSPPSDIKKISEVCRGFVCELLAGISSCCFWIEETQADGSGTEAECTVLFDEDRFFHVKNLRAQGHYSPLFKLEARDKKKTVDALLALDTDLAMSLDNFDLILESFLRCQSLSTYISSCEKTGMAYF